VACCRRGPTYDGAIRHCRCGPMIWPCNCWGGPSYDNDVTIWHCAGGATIWHCRRVQTEKQGGNVLTKEKLTEAKIESRNIVLAFRDDIQGSDSLIGSAQRNEGRDGSLICNLSRRKPDAQTVRQLYLDNRSELRPDTSSSYLKTTSRAASHSLAVRRGMRDETDPQYVIYRAISHTPKL